MHEAYTLFIILGLTLALFIWSHYRYDVVALMSLMALVLFNLIPSNHAFVGFGNSAVISVAAVMVISAALIDAGLVDTMLVYLKPIMKSQLLLIGTLCTIAAALSAFINNVGALTILMPVAIQSAYNTKLSPSLILMPLSFATILGGMITKIGTPPNLLIASYRENLLGTPLTMFDFTPTGLTVALAALAFIIFGGWRLVPERRKASSDSSDLYQINDYITEIQIPENSPVVGLQRQELEHLIEGDFSIVGLIRGRTKRLSIPSDEVLEVKDILIIEASHDDLTQLIRKGKLELYHGEMVSAASLTGNDISTIEAIVPPGSKIIKRSWQRMRIRSRLGLNLIAIARSGRSIKNRLNHVNFNPGDILLLQGASEALRENIVSLGLVPIAERPIQVGFKSNMVLPFILFLSGILLTAFQVLSIEISFTLVVILMVIFNLIPIRKVYKNIDWSIIIMLGALIPLGDALKNTGAAKMIGNSLVYFTGGSHILVILGVLILMTMTLSDVMNNAATAVVMAPIGADVAEILHMSPDPFLIAVSIGASCSCLTPISHQNNTLIMGPGGYKFFDYLWLGLPMELIVLITALPALYFFWL